MATTDYFFKTLADAINYYRKGGELSHLGYWQNNLRNAALMYFNNRKSSSDVARAGLSAVYKMHMRPKGIKRFHKKLSTFDIRQIEPRLRPLLEARIMASADLIKLNRDQAIESTLRRFAGWVSSVPESGKDLGDIRKEKTRIGKSLQQSTYEERRMMIDQGHKLLSNINQVIAEGNGAIAAIWHSHWRDASYDYRPDHKARDGKVYLMRNSWAREKGFVKPGAVGYMDDITQPAQEVYCRCYAEYLYSLSELPKDMLTKKGQEMLERTTLNAIGE